LAGRVENPIKVGHGNFAEDGVRRLDRASLVDLGHKIFDPTGEIVDVLELFLGHWLAPKKVLMETQLHSTQRIAVTRTWS
jgi:hypothetical protein